MKYPSPHFLIFCDGACTGNPGPGGWGAIVSDTANEVWELGGRSAATTNNQMELTAAIRALEAIAAQAGSATIYTDSNYLIRGITQWIHRWKKNGWKTAQGSEVLNQKFWEELLDLVSARSKSSKIDWHYVPGHSGIPGNERADEIATGFAKKTPPHLYRGPLVDYPIPLTVTADIPKPRTKKIHQSGKPYAYLSLVDGIAKQHKTWAECESRVKGVKAKYKKVMSADEADALLKDWGVKIGG